MLLASENYPHVPQEYKKYMPLYVHMYVCMLSMK